VNDADTGRIWLYRNLVNALLFSDGFYLDLAWLPLLSRHIQNEVSSLRRLFAKGYLTIVSRIPRETWITEFEPDIEAFLRNLDVLDWPASFARPDPRPVSPEIEFFEYPLRTRIDTLAYGERALESKLPVQDWFVNANSELTAVRPPDFVWRAMQRMTLSGKLFSKHSSTLDQELFFTSVSRIDEFLGGRKMCSVLGSTRESEQERIANCEHMLQELSRSAGGFSPDSLRRLQALAARTAELVGLEISDNGRDEEIGISVRGVIGYLLAVRQGR